MLSELKETNKKLREKLSKLKNHSTRLCTDNKKYMNKSNYMDTSYGLPCSSISRRTGLSECIAPICGPSMLSDRAKHVRGEATKRIDNLLHDWRDYKERADEEIRRRMKAEQNLKELLNRKDRETCELCRELESLKAVSKDQKKIIDQLNQELSLEEKCRHRCSELEMQIGKLNRHIAELNQELDMEAKCKNRCTELELQINKLNRHVAELTQEIRARDELIRSTESDKNKLCNLNEELREKNLEQKRKIEMCEQDVNETKMELEILEEMVRALNERKQNIFTSSLRQVQEKPITPVNVIEYNAPQLATRPPSAMSRSMKERTPPPFYATNDNIQSLEDRDRQLQERLSAMSTLKSMQRDHTEKCQDLAEHIRKLKEENKMKENAILELKRSNHRAIN